MNRYPATAKIDIPLENNTVIKKGSEIDITNGNEYKYALWHHTGIYDLPEEYVKLKRPLIIPVIYNNSGKE